LNHVKVTDVFRDHEFWGVGFRDFCHREERL
jgi:hypothetical protein